MLQSPEGWPAQTLADALRKNGFEVSKDSIRLHRNGTCACRRQKKESTS
jgi:hypothetical protein